MRAFVLLRLPHRVPLWVFLVPVIFAHPLILSADDATTSHALPYLTAARQFADEVLARGRDTYGQPTPLFVDGLNVDTR